MKYAYFLILLVAISTSLIGQEKPVTSLPISKTSQPTIKKAPAFKAKSIDGKPVSLEQYPGKVILINFWATWCPPCVAEIPELIQLQKQMGNKVQIIGISMDEDPQAVRQFAAKTRFNYPIIQANDDLKEKFTRITAIPTTVAIGKNGMISDVFAGYRNPQFFQDLVNRLSK